MKKTTRIGQVLLVQGVTGGAGATSLACAMSAVTASEGHETCLVDMDLQAGACGDYAGVQARRASQDLFENLDRVTDHHVNAATEVTGSGARIIGAPTKMAPPDLVTSSGFTRLSEVLRERYDVVIMDMPRTLAEWCETAFLESDALVAVMTSDLRAARNLGRLYNALGSGDPTTDETRRAAFLARMIPVFGRAPQRVVPGLNAHESRVAEGLGINGVERSPEDSNLANAVEKGRAMENPKRGPYARSAARVMNRARRFSEGGPS